MRPEPCRRGLGPLTAQAESDPMPEAKEQVKAQEYSPLRSSKKSLQNLDSLIPRFREMDVELKRLRAVLGNGEIKWRRPDDFQEGSA